MSRRREYRGVHTDCLEPRPASGDGEQWLYDVYEMDQPIVTGDFPI